MKYQYRVQGVDYNVEIKEVDGSVAKVCVNGADFEVELKTPAKKIKKTIIVEAPQLADNKANDGMVDMKRDTGVRPTAPVSGTPVLAPLPGTITDVKVKVGQQVKKGDTVVVLEAMKMQNNIEAEADGTISSVHVNQGEAVMEGNILVTIS